MTKKTKRYDGGGLADDETYLKKYANLSRGEKQQLDLDKRARLAAAQAEADAGDSLKQRASDTVGRALLAAPSAMGSPSATRDLAELDAYAAKREAERQRRLQEAKDSANYDEQGRALYPSKTPGKIDNNLMSFKKGGSVKSRGDGIAQRGHTKGRHL
jgi:hypothetical protein